MQRRYTTPDNERQWQGGGQRGQYRRGSPEETRFRDARALEEEGDDGLPPPGGRGESMPDAGGAGRTGDAREALGARHSRARQPDAHEGEPRAFSERVPGSRDTPGADAPPYGRHYGTEDEPEAGNALSRAYGPPRGDGNEA